MPCAGGSETEPGRGERVRDMMHGSCGAEVTRREHVPARAWARDPARGGTVSAAKEDNGWGQYGREVVVERLLVVRIIEASRCTRNSAFLFLAQKVKRSTTCPT